MSESPTPYSGLSRFMHWGIAGLILLVLYPVGLVMRELPDGVAKNTLYELHKSFGMTIFVLALIRVAIRAVEGFPALPADIPSWQRAAARGTHAALMALLFIVPSLGFIGTSMCCAPVNYFWLVPVPLEISGSMEQSTFILGLHKAAVLLLAAILALHIGAALYHGAIRRDGVLQRMVFGRR